ncbi:MAG: hypothetical protein BGN83_16135 [Rhizobium sp. 63-7]|nr:MAG: hypothetical protein BGN83_16135 [Rhizobium sp. 63-7]
MLISAKTSARIALTSRLLAGVFGASLIFALSQPAAALSELKQVPGQTTTQNNTPQTPADSDEPADDAGAADGLPQPDPLIDPTNKTAQTDDGKPVEVLYDVNKAPEPVRRMRQLIVEAAASGEIERLRALMNPGPNQTQVTIGETADDPIRALKELSGDSEGIEVLAILLDVISTGFVHTGQGTPDEMYVWPYFTEKSLSTLTPPEKVDLLRIITAGDYSDMLEFGGYNFYRVGISPDGQWKFFVAGD